MTDAVVLAKAWWMSGRGLDLTDEGMYLNWMASPWAWPWSSTQFAFLFQPVWDGAGADLVAVRRLTMLTLLIAGAGFFAVVTRRAFGLRRWASFAVGALLAPTVLLAVGSQSVFFTPSYNMVGLIALLVSGAALCAILLPVKGRMRPGAWSALWPWVLLGIGGVLCFASRPTAGALLLLIVIAALLVAGRWTWTGVGIAAGTALAAFLLMASAIDGNPVTFMERVFEGLHLYSLQTQRSALDALVNTFTYDLNWQQPDIVWGVLFGLLLAAAVVLGRSGRAAAAGIAVVTALVGIAAAWVMVAGVTPLTGRVGRSATVSFFLWSGLTAGALIVSKRVRGTTLAAVGALWLLPFAYAFGTHYSTVALAGSAAFCLLAGSLIALGAVDRGRRVLPMVAGVWLLLTALCLNAAAGAPPRQEPLDTQQVAVDLAGRGQLEVSPDMARYLDGVVVGVAGEGFEPGTPVLDLTGESPGLVYHLQAPATADSWVIGRYPGSRDRLSRELTLHTDCAAIGRSWLLVSPDGARRIDPEVLGDVGLRFPDDYRLALEETAPVRSGGYSLEVWAPQDSADLTVRCSAQR